LAVLLDETKKRIRNAIAPGSRLIRAGVIAIERQASYSMRSKIEMPFRTFVDMMMTTDAPIEEMLKEVVRRCGTPKLGLKDFTHLQSDLDLLVPYLDAAMNERRSGVNVLLYGPPGTGKTELTKSLADALGCELFEISYADEEDEAISGAMRLRAYRMAQSFFKHERLLFMFDEIEDVFADEGGGFPFGKKPPKNKAWMNRVLENNGTPTVWITNDVAAIDEAVIRRFDLSLEIPVPPLGKREEIVRAYSGDLLDEGTIRRLSRHERVSPAIVSSASRVTKSMIKSGADASGAFERIVSNTLKAQGYGTLETFKQASPGGFRPEYVNTETDLGLLAEGIKANPSARICLYGVPGTGKSAFGRWLADVMKRPFHLKKGSDLLSMWVGGTEQNIASAFEQAKRDGAVLVFDEVDSFLQDRREAQRSWEVTQVNEMLVQMENFEGVFIATTNLVDGLDRASLRRFDLKLEFGPLNAEQAWGMLCDEAQALGLKASGKKVRRMLDELSNLCAGDYAAVRRQSRFHPIKDVDDFSERLAAECVVKEDASGSRMGFLA
ncbi:MAG TPA: AAA family ATPase, partial [Sulfuricurvum sp.]|nr:AAA family ATPase [Sulfuricurvum sp.]